MMDFSPRFEIGSRQHYSHQQRSIPNLNAKTTLSTQISFNRKKTTPHVVPKKLKSPINMCNLPRSKSAASLNTFTVSRTQVTSPGTTTKSNRASNTQPTQDRDSQIKALKDKLRNFNEGSRSNREKCYRDQQTELTTIIKQVTKERLQLERQLQNDASESIHQQNVHNLDLEKLEASNLALKQQLDSLEIMKEKEDQRHKEIEGQFREQQQECLQLVESLKDKSSLCQNLETRLASVIESNSRLKEENVNLNKKVVVLNDVTEEYHRLKSTLSHVESECESARTEVSDLNIKIKDLEVSLEQLKLERLQDEDVVISELGGETHLNVPSDVSVGASVSGRDPCKSNPPARALSDSGFLSQNSLNGVAETEEFNVGDLLRLLPKNEKLTLEEEETRVFIHGKGLCNVYMALYNYSPIKDSNNRSHQEAEIPLVVGDYIIQCGDAVDDDIYFDGEFLDGRRGLVRSNLVKKLIGDSLTEFYEQLNLRHKKSDDSLRQNSDPTSSMTSPLELCQEEDGVLDLEKDFCSWIPPPRKIKIESKSPNPSIIVSWKKPCYQEMCDFERISSYQILLDGVVRSSVPSSCYQSELDISSVLQKEHYRVSVKAVEISTGQTSHEAACTIVVGRNASSLAPTNIKASRVCSNSISITWLPSNTNYFHIISINGECIKIVSPGIFHHSITALIPNTTYRITVGSKSRTGSVLSTSEFIEIQTQPVRLPEAPLNVRVDCRPEDGSLIISWLPVTINPSGGTSNGSPVTGYAIYTEDGQLIKDIEDATTDQAVLSQENVKGASMICIRTKTRNNEMSSSSEPCLVPKTFWTVDDDYSEGEVVVLNKEEETEANWERKAEDAELSIIAEETEDEKDKGTEQDLRIFVALFDYDPKTMSPNPDDFQDELSFKEGQLIRIFGEIDKDGFYWGESGGSTGFVPGNMVSQVHIDQQHWTADTTSRVNMVALYDYDPSLLSPNVDCDAELSFRAGDLIVTYGEIDDDGFYTGELRGRRGLIPSNFVTRISSTDIVNEASKSNRNTKQ